MGEPTRDRVEVRGAPRRRVAVIDDHAPSRALVTATVTGLGGIVVAEAETGAAGIELVAGLRPDAVVLAVGLPDRDGLEVAAQIMRRAPSPIVLLTSRAGADVATRARTAGAMAYLLKPLRAEELGPAIELAVARFGELSQASRENAALRRALEERKLVERAKGLVMQRLGLSEPDAFRALQKTAMDRRISMTALAGSVLRGEAVLRLDRRPHG